MMNAQFLYPDSKYVLTRCRYCTLEAKGCFLILTIIIMLVFSKYGYILKNYRGIQDMIIINAIMVKRVNLNNVLKH